LNVKDRENALIEEDIISLIRSERKKLLEIFPGCIFKFKPIDNSERDFNP